MILLWGLEHEPVLARVGAALSRLGAAFCLLDQRERVVAQVRVTTSGRVRGYVDGPRGRFDVGQVTALYARPFGAHELHADGPALRRAQAVERTLWTWAELAPAVVVNRLSAMAANHSKPFQLASIQRAGFRVPATLLTTSPAAARSFWKRHGEVIYKSASGVRSHVARLRPEHARRLADVVWCPTQFQEYVHGREYRVHVVGERVFACEVVSDADDYRYAETAVELHECALPADVAERCRGLAAEQRLAVAGIDLRCTRGGDWYCFEVNPSPGYPYFEQASGPISDAIARLLTGP